VNVQTLQEQTLNIPVHKFLLSSFKILLNIILPTMSIACAEPALVSIKHDCRYMEPKFGGRGAGD